MLYAEQSGLAAICARLGAAAERFGDATLRPAKLLARLAREGGSFKDFVRAV
jgi:3-hydroxyacyl-CoA dehydrogenase